MAAIVLAATVAMSAVLPSGKRRCNDGGGLHGGNEEDEEDKRP